MPREFAQFYLGRLDSLSGFIGWFQPQGLMDPVGVVVILKLFKLYFQIAPVPKMNLSQVLASDNADEPFGEGMRYLCSGKVILK